MVPHITVATILADLDARLAGIPTRNTASVRQVRRTFSRDLRGSPKELIRAVAFALTARNAEFDRFIAAELIAAHPQALKCLSQSDVRRLGRGMNSWGDVDVFACILAGPAWRIGRMPSYDDGRARRTVGGGGPQWSVPYR